MHDPDTVRLARRIDRANILLLATVLIAALALSVAASTFSRGINRDREEAAANRRHDAMQDIAIVAQLKYLASDHPDKDSVKLLEQIAKALKESQNAAPDIQFDPGHPSR